jgi:predicted RNA-binding protein YlqC (UPF0109 family)
MPRLEPSALPIKELRLAIAIVVTAMVDNPEAVNIEVVDAPGGKQFRIDADPRDRGKLIGAQGRSARALRVLLHGAGMKYGVNLTVDLGGW